MLSDEPDLGLGTDAVAPMPSGLKAFPCHTASIFSYESQRAVIAKTAKHSLYRVVRQSLAGNDKTEIGIGRLDNGPPSLMPSCVESFGV